MQSYCLSSLNTFVCVKLVDLPFKNIHNNYIERDDLLALLFMFKQKILAINVSIFLITFPLISST